MPVAAIEIEVMVAYYYGAHPYVHHGRRRRPQKVSSLYIKRKLIL